MKKKVIAIIPIVLSITFDLIGNLETLDYKIADSKEIIASYER